MHQLDADAVEKLAYSLSKVIDLRKPHQSFEENKKWTLDWHICKLVTIT